MLITENSLDDWTRSHAEEAQGVIVELVSLLISASLPGRPDKRFPLGDSIGQHGPDGILVTDVSFEPYVSAGRSIWEIGTSTEARRQATSDYSDSLKQVPVEIRKDSTFIFVTPMSGRRAWAYTWKDEDQASWLEQRKAD